MSKYKKYSNRGWFNESYRHSLASKGIKTSKRLSFAKKRQENDIKQLLTQAQQEALESRKERIGFTKLSGGQVRLKSIPHGVYNISIVRLKRGVYSVFSHSKEVDIPSLGPTNIYGDIGDVKFYVRTRISKDGGHILYSKEGIDLEDPKKYKFGSVKWQDTMLYNILEKRRHNEELSPVEKAFLEVQEEHLSSINYQQITYEPTTVQITEPTLTPLEKARQRFTPKPGWVGRGLEAEKQLGKKAVKGVGKVAKGFLATVALGLAGDVDGEPYQYRRPKTSVYGTSLPYTDNPILPIPPHNRDIYDVGFSKDSNKKYIVYLSFFPLKNMVVTAKNRNEALKKAKKTRFGFDNRKKLRVMKWTPKDEYKYRKFGEPKSIKKSR